MRHFAQKMIIDRGVRGGFFFFVLAVFWTVVIQFGQFRQRVLVQHRHVLHGIEHHSCDARRFKREGGRQRHLHGVQRQQRLPGL